MVTAVVVSILFSIFSTSVMTYITLATPIGPWMAPTLALIGIMAMRAIPHFSSQDLLYAISAGSVGGILATAFGFSFPTLYFLNKKLFVRWAQNPSFFMFVVASLALAGGLFAWWLAQHSKKPLLEDQKLEFPIGVLVYKIVAASHNVANFKKLAVGFVATAAYCVLCIQKQYQRFILPASLTLSAKHTWGIISIPALQLPMAMLPMLWSIGFIAGSMITVPLLIGTLTRIFFTDLVQSAYFSYMSSADFLFAFCSGMVVAGALSGLFATPKQLIDFYKKQYSARSQNQSRSRVLSVFLHPFFIIPSLLTVVLFSYFKFSYAAQCYSIFFTLICAYQITAIAGKIGLAFLGRFATFVMLPALVIFRIDGVQATLLATFVEICGGIATDLLFGQKAGQLAGLSSRRMFYFQLLGIVVAACTLAVVLWVLVTHFQLGSDLLFAERAQGRALLVNAVTFDYKVLLLGSLYGMILKKLKFNPMLVLGGLLMSLSLTLGLVLGGLSALLVNKKEEWEPFCSGMYAANSLGMIVQALW